IPLTAISLKLLHLPCHCWGTWGEARPVAVNLPRASPQNSRGPARVGKENSMAFHDLAGAACRALTARKDGPSLYEVCDPLLLKGAGGDAHLAQFYRTALANAALR